MNTPALTRRRMVALTGGAAATALAGCLGGGGGAGVADTLDAYVVVYHWGYAAFDEDGNELDVIEVEPETEVTLHVVNDHAYEAFEVLPDPVAAELDEFDALGRTEEKVEAGDLPEPEDDTVEQVYETAHGHGHGDDDGHGHEDDGHGHDDDDGHGHEDDGHGHGDDDGHGHEDDGHGHDDDGHSHDDDGHSHDDDGHSHDDDGHSHDDDDGHGHDDDGHSHDDDDGHGHDDDGHDHDHEGGKLDHGFSIPELDLQVEVPWDKDEPVEATVVVEDAGVYEAVCTVDCGYYHAYQQDSLIEVSEE